MTAPAPAVTYQGQGVLNADLVNTFVQTVVNIAALRGFVGLNNMVCIVQGSTAPNDGGQGTYYYNSSSTATDNGTTIIVPTGNTQGAWIRLTGI